MQGLHDLFEAVSDGGHPHPKQSRVHPERALHRLRRVHQGLRQPREGGRDRSAGEHKRFKYPIALPAPTLYAQFQGVHQPEPIIASLFRLGFVDVFEVARAAEIVSYAISRAMREEDRPKPVISSACPGDSAADSGQLSGAAG